MDSILASQSQAGRYTRNKPIPFGVGFFFIRGKTIKPVNVSGVNILLYLYSYRFLALDIAAKKNMVFY